MKFTIHINLRKRIEELEKRFPDKINVVAHLIGDTASRKLNIDERSYIGNFIEELNKLAQKSYENNCDNLVTNQLSKVADKV